MVGAHNADRAAAGLGGLCENGQLAGFAQNWANQMAARGTLVHQNLGSLIGSTSFCTMGENILVGPGELQSRPDGNGVDELAGATGRTS